MSKINVGVVTHDFFPWVGGMGRGLYEIYCRRLMSDPDLEFLFFSPCENDLPNHTQVARFSRKIGFNLTFSLVVNKNIANWVKDKKLDLLSLHCGTGGVFLFKKLGIPIVYTCHGTYYRQYHLTPKLRWKWILSKLEQVSYKRADMVRAISKDVRDIIVKKYGIETEKVKIIYNGVNVAEFRQLGEIDKIENSLLFVGRLGKRKGISLLVKEIVPLVKKDIPNVKLFIAGSGSLKRELEAFIKSHGLESNILFLGWVSGQELVRWYNQVCVFVNPTMLESFGQTTTEAMSCGTPVIASKIPAIKEIIEDGKNGLLVEYGDIKTLSKTIIDLLNDSAKREKLSIAGRRTVEERFSWDITARDMKSVFLSVMDGFVK